MTIEEKKEVLQKVIFGPLWPTDCEPPLNPDNTVADATNFSILVDAFKQIPDEQFTVENVYKTVMALRKSGDLVRKKTAAVVIRVAPEPVNPALNMPDANELLEKLNRRIAWIQNNKIRRDDLPPSDAPKTPQPAKPVFTVPSKILEAHKLVDSMTVGDIGSTTDGAGRHTLLPIRMKKFHLDIDERYAKRESPESILENTKTLIKDSGSGSIR